MTKKDSEARIIAQAKKMGVKIITRKDQADEQNNKALSSNVRMEQNYRH